MIVFFPLSKFIVFFLRHFEHRLELFIAKVEFLHITFHTLRELALQVFIRELFIAGFLEALEGVGGFVLFVSLDFISDRPFFVHLDLKGIGVDPLIDDVLLPVGELDLKMGGLLSGFHFDDGDFLGVTAILNLFDVLFSAFDTVPLLVLVGLVADPDVDGVVGVKDLAILIVEVLLHEAEELLDEHVASGVGDVEKPGLEVSRHVHVTGGQEVFLASKDFPEACPVAFGFFSVSFLEVLVVTRPHVK